MAARRPLVPEDLSVEANARAADFTKYAVSLMLGEGLPIKAAEIFERRWPRSLSLDLVRKAAVAPATTTDATWASPVVALRPLAEAFVALLRPATVLGRLQGVRRVPFNVRFPVQVAGAGVGWIGEGKPVPVAELDFTEATFKHSKIAGLVVVTKELVRSADPAAIPLIQADMIATVAQFTDEALLDPAAAATADAPASITNGADEIASTGSTATQVEADLKALVASLVDAGILFLAPYFVMKPSTALHLATLRTTGGDRAFPDVTITGGSSWGIPVLVSANVGDYIVLVDAAELMLAEGEIELDSSEHLAIQMADDPVTGAANVVSLFQTNSLGLMVKLYRRFQMRRAGAAAYISGVSY